MLYAGGWSRRSASPPTANTLVSSSSKVLRLLQRLGGQTELPDGTVLRPEDLGDLAEHVRRRFPEPGPQSQAPSGLLGASPGSLAALRASTPTAEAPAARPLRAGARAPEQPGRTVDPRLDGLTHVAARGPRRAWINSSAEGNQRAATPTLLASVFTTDNLPVRRASWPTQTRARAEGAPPAAPPRAPARSTWAALARW